MVCYQDEFQESWDTKNTILIIRRQNLSNLSRKRLLNFICEELFPQILEKYKSMCLKNIYEN